MFVKIGNLFSDCVRAGVVKMQVSGRVRKKRSGETSNSGLRVG